MTVSWGLVAYFVNCRLYAICEVSPYSVVLSLKSYTAIFNVPYAVMTTDIDLRRLEGISQNASRPDRGLMIDGWSVGLSPGLAKRSRCVNPFYPSTRPFETNLAQARAAFAKANLPCVFRLTPFVNDATLDSRFEALGYVKYDPALVMTLDLSQLQLGHLRSTSATVKPQPDLALAARWVAEMRGDDARETAGLAERWRLSAVDVSPSFAFNEAGVRVARSVAIRDDDHVGIFDVGTDATHLNLGYASALLAAQLRDARDGGARIAYLQVRADNPARRLYERFGFCGTYEYWYRALPEDAR